MNGDGERVMVNRETHRTRKNTKNRKENGNIIYCWKSFRLIECVLANLMKINSTKIVSNCYVFVCVCVCNIGEGVQFIVSNSDRITHNT